MGAVERPGTEVDDSRFDPRPDIGGATDPRREGGQNHVAQAGNGRKRFGLMEDFVHDPMVTGVDMAQVLGHIAVKPARKLIRDGDQTRTYCERKKKAGRGSAGALEVGNP